MFTEGRFLRVLGVRASEKVSYKKGQPPWVLFCFLRLGLTAWRMVMEEADTWKCMEDQMSFTKGLDFCSLTGAHHQIRAPHLDESRVRRGGVSGS